MKRGAPLKVDVELPLQVAVAAAVAVIVQPAVDEPDHDAEYPATWAMPCQAAVESPLHVPVATTRAVPVQAVLESPLQVAG
jgi:hypothetical protein